MEASGAKASPADGRPKAPGLSGPAREIVTQEIIQALIKSPNLPLDVSVNTVDIFVYELIWAVVRSQRSERSCAVSFQVQECINKNDGDIDNRRERAKG